MCLLSISDCSANKSSKYTGSEIYLWQLTPALLHDKIIAVAGMAQVVERVIGNDEAVGPTPAASTNVAP